MPGKLAGMAGVTQSRRYRAVRVQASDAQSHNSSRRLPMVGTAYNRGWKGAQSRTQS